MKRVLIIEDDVVVSSIYRRKYELSGLDVENANDGVAGLAKLNEFRPDIVQLDLQLPKMNGIEVIKELRSKPEFANLPILVLSSFYKHDLVKEAWKAGATKCVTKIECTPILALEIIQQMLAEGHQPTVPASAPAPERPVQPGGAFGYGGYPGQPPTGYPPPGYPPQAPYPANQPPGFPAGYPPPSSSGYPPAPSTTGYPPAGYPVQPGAYPPAGYPPNGGYPPQQAQPPAAPRFPGYPPAPDSAATEARAASPAPDSQPTARNGAPSLDIRQEFLSRAASIQANLRERANGLIRAKGVSGQLPLLREFHEACHTVASLAGTTGFVRVSHLAEALELLLKELHAKPARVTVSSLRTIAHAADALIALCQEAQGGSEGSPQSGLILAVDDEPISRKVLANALSKASLKTISLDDPHLALKVLNENAFDLIFLDGDMPGMSGFELCKQLRALPSNKTTPVVFVTSLNDFDSRAQSSLAGGNDLIAKPFLMIELAVKALTYLMRPKPQAAKTPSAAPGSAAAVAPGMPPGVPPAGTPFPGKI